MTSISKNRYWMTYAEVLEVYGVGESKLLAMASKFGVRCFCGKVYVQDMERVFREAPFLFEVDDPAKSAPRIPDGKVLPVRRRRRRSKGSSSFLRIGVFSASCPFDDLRKIRMRVLRSRYRRRQSSEDIKRNIASSSGSMKFDPHYWPMIRSGSKNVTRRLENRWHVGQVVEIPESGMHLKIVAIRQEPLSRVGHVNGRHHDYVREGFQSRTAFLESFLRHYPEATPATLVWRIAFVPLIQ